ncbi:MULTISPECIES: GNAT family N-acetyltransferase [Paeniglutamicibacter]|uniref:Ribosomal protein S18 acetylase RimI-like enzyme n=1 Tax=Paeniglutamicibacter sulfureus TaxID=43666 RepID=A0ABU2BPC5_9MICC|nr:MULTISPECIES: GNAT family N-acetyltransferase [Paeniglutamicibacter]MCV9995697.1 GNAT family N-acetyltransferase [Paeniglutamicibacter sp. ZC-3]MDR7360131.1 ribosomal protein S18 acetylase RimI-like enzyme [Paeniglutamicibacter sulfureus]
MENIAYSLTKQIEAIELIGLYNAVGWSAYTNSPDTLLAAIQGSHTVAVVHVGNQLVGLARSISDGASICYLQDILVHPDHHRAGIGRGLAELIFAQYPGVRQKVLLTDDEPGQKAFYESLGMTQASEFPSGAMLAFVKCD